MELKTALDRDGDLVKDRLIHAESETAARKILESDYTNITLVDVEERNLAENKKISNLLKTYSATIPIEDNRNGNRENTNGGAYVTRMQFKSPAPCVYLIREYCSYHGDLEPMPKFEQVSFVSWIKAYRKAVDSNMRLPKDLQHWR